MTQDDYKLLTGKAVNYSSTDWTTLVGIASERLASFLCLENLPELEGHDDLKLLLANFLYAMIEFQGTADTIQSKSVRNFTINFKSSATNAFEQIYTQYRDIIEKYSNCGTLLKVEHSVPHCERGFVNGYINF